MNFVGLKIKKYNVAVENIKRIFNNMQDIKDFTPCAQEFHQLAAEEDDHDFRLIYFLMEARAYYFQSALNPGKAEIYANSALSLIDAVKKQTKYDWMYYYARAIESNCYHQLRIPFDDEKWISMINELEEFTEINKVDWNNFYSPMVFEDVYYALATYYKQRATHDNLLNIYDNTKEKNDEIDVLAEKMSYYQKLYTEFCLYLTEDSGVRSRVIDYNALIDSYDSQINSIIISLTNYSSFKTQQDLVDNVFSNIENLSDIADECKSCLKEFDYNSQNVRMYIAFNRLIAKALAIKAMFYRQLNNPEQEAQQANECHDIVARMLRLPDIIDEYAIYEISYVCSYMFLIKTFTKDDIDYFHDNSVKVLNSSLHKNDSLLRKENTVYLICEDCKQIIEKYGYNEKIYDLGLKCLEELRTYSDILKNAFDKKGIAELQSFFVNYDKKSNTNETHVSEVSQ